MTSYIRILFIIQEQRVLRKPSVSYSSPQHSASSVPINIHAIGHKKRCIGKVVDCPGERDVGPKKASPRELRDGGVFSGRVTYDPASRVTCTASLCDRSSNTERSREQRAEQRDGDGDVAMPPTRHIQHGTTRGEETLTCPNLAPGEDDGAPRAAVYSDLGAGRGGTAHDTLHSPAGPRDTRRGCVGLRYRR